MNKAKIGAIVLVVITLLAVIAVMFFMALGSDDAGGGGGGTVDDTPSDTLSGLVLIKDSVTTFNVVTAKGAGTAGIRAATGLVSELRRLGVDVNDPISDSKEDLVYDYEIIIGTGCRNRGDECNISERDLGKDGYIIKVVGKRVVIAGGTSTKTRYATELFMKEYLGITEELTALPECSVDEDLLVEVLTDYDIDSLKIGSNDISDYTIVCDFNNFSLYPAITSSFQETVQLCTGIYLECKDIAEVSANSKQIIFRMLPLSYDESGARTYEDGFHIRVEGENLIFESEYENAFVKLYDEFIKNYVTSKTGEVVIPSDLSYSKCASIVKYSDFGAVGDGVTDDFNALLLAHEYANEGKQKVVADGENYYIGLGGRQIPIMTDVDWGTAKFTIDDTVSGIDRKKHIFVLKRDHESVTVLGARLENSGVTDTSLKKLETTSIPWLAPYLEGDSLIMITNLHKDYIRYGDNANTGNERCDVLLVDKDGNIDPSTPVTCDFDSVAQVVIHRVDDTPITVNGGVFETICCRSDCKHTKQEGCYKGSGESYCRSNAYSSFSRGIRIERANSTLQNIDHKVLDEPDDGSFPYYGFLLFFNAHNVLIKDCNLTGHKKYCEYKTNAENYTSWVWMGTYDFVVEYSNAISFVGVTQENGKNDIGDSGYWGIMSSNRSKNLYFKDCVISRIDAHRGFWNLTVEDCIIGHTFNVIGGGTINVKNTQRRVGESFINLRSDYGATFEGDITLTNCLLDGIMAYDTVWGGASARPTKRSPAGYIIASGFLSNSTKYLGWDFGYTCYMPITVTLENFVSNISTTYVYNTLYDQAFTAATATKQQYQITKKITYVTNNTIEIPSYIKNYNTTKARFPIAAGGTTLKSIPTEEKTINAK